VLRDILADLPETVRNPALIVGSETGDDAVVYRLDDDRAIVATTDFFMPIVDDPYDFGRIAAANALSDVYAMGGSPLFALAIAGVPVGRLPAAAVGRILAGGQALCAEAGIAVAGGHTIDSPEPIYGLAVVGLVDPARVKRNSEARAGDALVLGKALGVGVMSAAFRKGALPEDGYRQMLEGTTRLNTIGTDLAALPAVHAMTDITGFGLIGHLLEICRGSGLGAALDMDAVPVLPAAVPLAQDGFTTGAAARNRDDAAGAVDLPGDLADWRRTILHDPQTSGGLLVACDAAAAEDIVARFHAAGFADAAMIGRITEGAPRVTVV